MTVRQPDDFVFAPVNGYRLLVMLAMRHARLVLFALLLALVAASCSDGSPAHPATGDVDGGPSLDDASADAVAPRPVDDATLIDSGPVASAFGLDVRPHNTTCKAPARPPSGVGVVFNEVFANTIPAPIVADQPTMLGQIPADPSRWFVSVRDGRLFSFGNVVNPPPRVVVANLATLSGLPVATNGEGGFLGFAFHPKFALNGRLYVSWTSADGPQPNGMKSRIGYMTSADNGATFTSYTNLIAFDQVNDNHKGGSIAFGLDGYLYFSFGDGGGNDIQHGQAKAEFFSKILRINVDSGSPYAIPSDNPFATTPGAEPATFAYGFRNPFRFSIDRATGDVWVGDVGQGLWEEVDRVSPGANYGWPCREGKHNYTGYHPTFCPLGVTNLTEPLVEHEHVAGVSPNRSITGGVVYRGKSIPSFVGTYVYADFWTQELFSLTYDPLGNAQANLLNPNGPASGFVHFAEDNDGEVFVLSLYGRIYKMSAAAPEPISTFPERLSATGCVDVANPTIPASGLIPYSINMELWSDGAEKERYLALPDGTTMSVDASGDISLPSGSVLMKSFALGGKRVETRLFVRHDDGEWAGYSYEWLPDGSDALLLPSSKRKQVGSQSWFYPSRVDCVRCHTEAAGRSLGLELGQLDRDFVYASTNRIANQVATLEHIGMFSVPIGTKPSAFPTLDGSGTVEAKARAYLHVNCSQCHRPSGGGGGTDLDLRFSIPLSDTKTCNVDGQVGDFGVAGAKRLVPGTATTSLISLRPHTLEAGRMPPLASSVVDAKGLAVIDSWIASLVACP